MQTCLTNSAYTGPLHERVERQVLKFGVNSVIGAVWKHVDVPALALQLFYPARGVNALAQCDKQNSQVLLCVLCVSMRSLRLDAFQRRERRDITLIPPG